MRINPAGSLLDLHQLWEGERRSSDTQQTHSRVHRLIHIRATSLITPLQQAGATTWGWKRDQQTPHQPLSMNRQTTITHPPTHSENPNKRVLHQHVLHKQVVNLGGQRPAKPWHETDNPYLSALKSDALSVFESCDDGKNGWSSPENKATEIFSLLTSALRHVGLRPGTHTGRPISCALATRNFPFFG